MGTCRRCTVRSHMRLELPRLGQLRTGVGALRFSEYICFSLVSEWHPLEVEARSPPDDTVLGRAKVRHGVRARGRAGVRPAALDRGRSALGRRGSVPLQMWLGLGQTWPPCPGQTWPSPRQMWPSPGQMSPSPAHTWPAASAYSSGGDDASCHICTGTGLAPAESCTGTVAGDSDPRGRDMAGCGCYARQFAAKARIASTDAGPSCACGCRPRVLCVHACVRAHLS